jgi:hypothetical protein
MASSLERTQASSESPSGAPSRPALVRWAGLASAFAIAALVLFPVLDKSGVWDPFELDTADLARRIAVHTLHAENLATAGLRGLPSLTDLGMGELPFTSMALAFRIFGVHDWSGRLALAVWALAGAMALYALLARLVGPRAGVYGVAALVTMPLYFMQARTMLGDAVTMSAVAMSFSGLLGALLDDDLEGATPRRRGAWFVLGLVGLGAGYLSRGMLLGVAVPALAVGLGWLVLRASDPIRSGSHDPFGDAVGLFAAVVGAVALGVGLWVLFRSSAEAPLRRVLGFALLKRAPSEATFDWPVRVLGHALFPWSAFLPFAAGRMFQPPAHSPGSGVTREARLRVILVVGAGVALAIHALLAPYAGALPFVAPAILAAIVAVAVSDLERGAAPSRAVALGVLVLGFVLYRDMAISPEKALSVFGLDKASFPKTFEPTATKLMQATFACFAVVVAATWFEAQPNEPRASLRAWAARRTSDYARALRELAGAWSGNLLLAGIVAEAALFGLGAMVFVGRRVAWSSVDKLPSNVADVALHAWWILPVAAFAALPLLVAARDAIRAVFALTRLPRATGMLLAAAVAGGVLGFGYYPALAAQLSPKQVFEAYSALRKPGEPLALLGVRSRAASYYQGEDVESVTDATQAFAFLTKSAARRWVILSSDDLPRLNALWRKTYAHNLPVLDGHSSQALLASNDLGGHANESWVGRMILDERVEPSHRVEAAFEDQLEVIGWDIVDDRDRVVPSVVPQKPYHLRLYFRVLQPIPGNWKVFIHIDGFQRRHNGDHSALDGKYPMALWQPGDVVLDDYAFQLEPNFTPGDYALLFGFFSGETRFKVSRGAHVDNRVSAGTVVVR